LEFYPQIIGRLFDINITGEDSGVFDYKNLHNIIWGSII